MVACLALRPRRVFNPLLPQTTPFSSFAVSRELNTTANGERGGGGGWKIRIAEWKTGRGNSAMGPQSSAFSLHPRMSSGHELDIEAMSSLKERNDMIYMNKYQLLRGLHFLQIWQMFLRSDSSRCRDALRGNTPSRSERAPFVLRKRVAPREQEEDATIPPPFPFRPTSPEIE